MSPTPIALILILLSLSFSNALFPIVREDEVFEEEIESAFADFVHMYKKVYSSAEEKMARYAIFRQNYLDIEEHNQKDTKYRMGVNMFSDLTVDEFKTNLLTLNAEVKHRVNPTPEEKAKMYQARKGTKRSASQLIDWQELGFDEPIKNQGHCGACYSFAAAATTEFAYWKETGEIIDIAEQQVVDCSREGGNIGCKDGWMIPTYEYWMNGGFMLEEDYPYMAEEGTCAYDAEKVFSWRPTGYEWVEQYSEQAMLDVLQDHVVAVAINAAQLHQYKEGILWDCAADIATLDHGVALIAAGEKDDGYGNMIPYWKLRNSWGAKWGEGGYFYIERDIPDGAKEGECCIFCHANYAIQQL